MNVTSADFPEIRWHGHWIWVPEEPVQMGSPFHWETAPRPQSHGLFRREFSLANVPSRVPARIVADSRYQLFVNGKWVGHGPARSQPRRMSYDMYDLAPYLRTGDNVIAVFVKYFGTPKSDWIPAVGNATLGKTGVMVFEADLGGDWLVSNAAWLARHSDAWTNDAHDPDAMTITAGIPVESFDARRLDPEWAAPGYDDSDWKAAQVITPIHIGGRGRSQPPADPYGPLLPRGTAQLTGAMQRPVTVAAAPVFAEPDISSPNPAARVLTSVLDHSTEAAEVAFPAPVSLTGDQHARWVIDMGRIVAGFVDFEIDAPEGTVFDFSFVEEPITCAPEFGAHGGSRYIARGRKDRHRVSDKKGFRYAYIIGHSTQGDIALTDFSVREDCYPWSGEADFECSDPSLTRLYHAGRRTVELNSWDSFIDCPTREQRAWVGDAVVHQMVHLATNADWDLCWRQLNLGNAPRYDGILPMSVAGDVEHGGGFTIPDWSLHWVHALHNMYRFTGHQDRIKALMPTAERILRWFLPYQTKSGVLQDVVEWNLVDWSALYSEAQSSIVTALWARGLAEFAEIAEWLGESFSGKWARETYAKIREGFEQFWDEGRGGYVDYVTDGKQQRPMNQLAGALAIVSDLAPRNRWDRILDAITDESRLVVRSWMFPGEAVDSHEERGRRFHTMIMGDLNPDWDVEREIVIAEPFMSYVVHDAVAKADRAADLPRLMNRWQDFLTDGYDTFGENWGTGTRVHGWSSTPTKDIVFSLLGITPAKPGYEIARVAPCLAGLEWVHGSAPTPFGPISVELRDGHIQIDAPIPVLLDLEGRTEQELSAGKHTLPL